MSPRAAAIVCVQAAALSPKRPSRVVAMMIPIRGVFTIAAALPPAPFRNSTSTPA